MLCVEEPHEIGRVIGLIAFALVIKGALTIITFGIKLPGKSAVLWLVRTLMPIAGIFIPSLVVGACFGRIVGLGMEYIEYSHPDLHIFDVCRETDCIVPGLYAMVSRLTSDGTVSADLSRLAQRPLWLE